MKNLKLGISALALTVATTAFAQTTSNPWLIGVGAHGENHIAQANNFSNTFAMNNFTKRLFNMNNFSITPPLSKLTVARNINKYLVADLQASVGNVGNKKFNMDKEFFLMAGLGLQFKFNGLWNEESWFDPYVRVGANYLRHDYSGLTFPRTDINGNAYSAYDGDGNTTGKANHFALSTGLGSNFWITKNFGLGIQGDYVSTPGDKTAVPNFWQASASLLFRFGAKPAPAPVVVPEPEPTPAPVDTDGDGLTDDIDKCPLVPGPKENQGCPWPDTDGDGLTDDIDKCPLVPGPKENQGCPWPADEVTKKLEGILFDFNKATIQAGSSQKLDDAATIIKGAADTNFLVVGMTDAKGAAAYNLNLSKQRAKSVVTALESRGVNGSQLKSIGIGSQEAKVPATASDAERQQDRKVIVRSISGDEWTTYKKDDVTVAKPVKKAVKKTTTKKVIKKKK